VTPVNSPLRRCRSRHNNGMDDPLSFTSDCPPLTWEDAAQDAAFEGRCFCTYRNGHLINSDALADGIRHDSPFATYVTIGERPMRALRAHDRSPWARTDYAEIRARLLRTNLPAPGAAGRTTIDSNDPDSDANAYEVPLVGA
jgi:hypothetical protein